MISIAEKEKTGMAAFFGTISKWIYDFGTSGKVHPEDLEDYLKKTNINYIQEFFREHKTTLSIFYRKKVGNCFRKTMMEIIPAKDYASDNEIVFLYIKDIEN